MPAFLSCVVCARTTADKEMFTRVDVAVVSQSALYVRLGLGVVVCGGGLPAVWTVMSQIFVQTVWHPFFPAEGHAGLLLVRNPLRWSLPSTFYLDHSLRAYCMPVTYFSVISGKLCIDISCRSLLQPSPSFVSLFSRISRLCTAAH